MYVLRLIVALLALTGCGLEIVADELPPDPALADAGPPPAADGPALWIYVHTAETPPSTFRAFVEGPTGQTTSCEGPWPSSAQSLTACRRLRGWFVGAGDYRVRVEAGGDVAVSGLHVAQDVVRAAVSASVDRGDAEVWLYRRAPREVILRTVGEPEPGQMPRFTIENGTPRPFGVWYDENIVGYLAQRVDGEWMRPVRGYHGGCVASAYRTVLSAGELAPTDESPPIGGSLEPGHYAFEVTLREGEERYLVRREFDVVAGP